MAYVREHRGSVARHVGLSDNDPPLRIPIHVERGEFVDRYLALHHDQSNYRNLFEGMFLAEPVFVVDSAWWGEWAE